ncbi:MAG: hypothetical protein IIT78_01840, partial [Mycoplasmataceae bacterium]|nr:hypothetical protein [Mycoplasmataceae bacterium]
MKNKTKKLFFTYIGVSVIAIITPITIVCGTSCNTNKIANSKQTNRAINKVSKVPNFVNANLFQNTNYGKSTITINQASGLVNGGIDPSTMANIWHSSTCNVPNQAINSFLSNLDNSANSAMSYFECDNYIPQNIHWTSLHVSLSGSLNIAVDAWCSNNVPHVSETDSFSFNNNEINYDATNYNNGYNGYWFWGQGTNDAPLQVTGSMNFNGINNQGNLDFSLDGTESVMPCPDGNSWPSDHVGDPSVTYSTNGNWILTLPFNMNTIYNNIQNAISSISLNYYEFQQQWETGLVNQIDQDIKGCIPSYMSNCFNISPLDSTVNYGNGTSGTITTNLYYVDTQNQTVGWGFTTNITAPAQPSNQPAYNLFK